MSSRVLEVKNFPKYRMEKLEFWCDEEDRIPAYLRERRSRRIRQRNSHRSARRSAFCCGDDIRALTGLRNGNRRGCSQIQRPSIDRRN